MKYPYYLTPGKPRNAGIPFVEVVYKNASKKTTPIVTLVDSGASVSFAPLDVALWLGIKVDRKKYLDIRGFNNTITRCYPGMTTLVIDGHECTIPMYFGGGPKLQCILGQDPFFDLAKITFERYNDSFSIDWIKNKASINSHSV